MLSVRVLAVAGAALVVGAGILLYPSGPSKEEVACLSQVKSSAEGALLACTKAASEGSAFAGYALAVIDPTSEISEAASTVAPAVTEKALAVLRRVDPSREDRDAAVADLRAAAGEGYAPAQRWLAVVLLAGETGEVQSSEAADWLERAARQGSADAQFLLAGVYRTGNGVPADRQRMRDLYLEAAQRGHAAAAYNLSADFYARGKSDEAFLWLKRSAAGGFAPAHIALARAASSAGPDMAFASAVHFQLAAAFSEGESRSEPERAAALLVTKFERQLRLQFSARVEQLEAAIRGNEELVLP